jgi:myosin-5
VQDQQLEGVDDICSLSTVTEAALLHTIRVRYSRLQIYTRVSRILIALNPFQPLSIYSFPNLLAHAKAADSADLPPHIFGTGHDALRGLRDGAKDQAIVISGESGAGKTESAKLLLKYVAEVVRGHELQDERASDECVSGLEERVMQTNPVLEAFGNAMTTRNNNSSRFGKWLDLRFSSGLRMLGCRITSYLLEVTRVCSQQAGERSYHVFFQLMGVKDTQLRETLGLQDMGYYRYLRGSVPTAPGIDDQAGFQDMHQALFTLGFSNEEQLQIFRIVVGVLTLGNCEFLLRDGEDSLRLEDVEPIQCVASLLEVDATTLNDACYGEKLS